ncbi:MAG: hypothetical protein GY732_05385 [Gammaproteobacteria bacterium]|nr:hypothetical protein [Gammaproteobacteria bacterium]
MNLKETDKGVSPLQFMAKHQQKLKWIIYTLLILNFGYYLFDDWRAAQSTLLPGASFLKIAIAYATSFDEIGWFFIIFLLEVETYWLEDESTPGPVYWLIQIFRVLCYVVVCHTLYAFIVTVIDLEKATVVTDIGGLCALVGEDLYFVRNLLYELVDAGNCTNLSAGGEIYRFFDEPVVSDTSGYRLELSHAWIDVVEISGWIAVSALLTFVMVLQNKGIYDSRWIRGAERLQHVGYVIIACTAFYWLFFGHYIYTWDILLWIGGFAIIDSNLAEWRHELEDEHELQEQAEVEVRAL